MKLKLFKRSLLIVCMAAFSAGSYAADKSPVTVQETAQFTDVVATVAQMDKKYGKDNVLIVLDIDNTLLTSSVDLGGDVWYQWQRGKLDIKPTKEQKVRCLFNDSIGLLYELGTMTLTEETVPATISQWQATGNTVMALTSRSPKYRTATERELGRHNIDFTVTGLAPKGEALPVYRQKLKREFSYMKGVMMTTGMDKGVMLDFILKKTDRKFDAIVFVDDSPSNVEAVQTEFAKHTDVETTIFHYTKVEEDRIHKNGKVLTLPQALKMASDWTKLNTTLNFVFPERDLKEGCLDN